MSLARRESHGQQTGTEDRVWHTLSPDRPESGAPQKALAWERQAPGSTGDDDLAGFLSQDRTARGLLLELLEKVFQANPAAMSLSALDGGRFLDVNQALLRLLDYQRYELINRTPAELGIWVDSEDPKTLANLVRKKRWVRDWESQLRTKAGKIRLVLISAELIDWDGLPCLLAVTQDVTEDRLAAKALEESEARRGAILGASPDAIITVGADGTVLELNTAAQNILGYSNSQAARRRWPEIILPSRHEGSSDPAGLDRTFETNGLQAGKRLEILAQRADGAQFPAEITISPVQLSGQTIYGVWLRDITGQRHLENQLWRSQKMEAVGRLAGGVAHDFNNLLTVITGYSDLVLASLAPSDPRRRNVEEILKAGDRAASLTRQLLAFSRRQVLAPQPLDLNTVVLNLDKMLRRLIGEDIDVVNVLAPNLWTVKADPAQIEQALVNLAVNARDAMADGGKLTIVTANATMDERAGRRYQPPMPAGDYVMLAVSDTGCGMDQKTQSLIFEPFFTTKEEGKGTGLGLSTVYGVIKQSGGFIWVSSEPGQGASFKIYLPRAQGHGANDNAGLSKQMPPAKGTETVLLAEDEDAVRGLVRGVLESAGFTVLEASRGEDAIRIARAYRSPIDLLLTDVVMPQMGGRELAKSVEKLDSKIKVLYMSGYAEKAIVHQGILEPGAVLIQKPFTPDDLVGKVREVLDSPKEVPVPSAAAF